MTFREKLMDQRRRRGLSQEQLADRLGVTRQSVSKWETGEAMPELAKLIALADLFEVSVDYLVRDSLDRPAASPEMAQLEQKLEQLRRETDTTFCSYTSKVRFLGIPLVSIRLAHDRYPTRRSTAVGIIAIGNFAVGVVSLGLISLGLFSVGMIAVGLLALAGVSIGGLAVGGVAMGVWAFGASAVGIHLGVGAAAVGRSAAGLSADGTQVLLLGGATLEAARQFCQTAIAWPPLRALALLFMKLYL